MRILIADERPLMLAGLRLVLEHADGFELAGAAGNPAELLELVRSERADALLLDIRLARPAPQLALLEQLKQAAPKLLILVTGGPGEEALVEHALSRGAGGYIAKTIDPADLPTLLRQAIHGGIRITPLPPADSQEPTLTDRERAILRGIARGLTNRELAAELGLAEQTIKTHASNTFRKLGVKNRTEAALHAHAHPRLLALDTDPGRRRRTSR